MRTIFSFLAITATLLLLFFFVRQQDTANIDTACLPYLCKDGTTHPRCTEEGHPINYFAPPCLTNGGEVPESGLSSCEELKAAFDNSVATHQTCSSDSDCALFEFSCPYVTCGIAVNPSALNELQQYAESYTTCLEENGEPVSCAGCVEMRARCESSRCITQ